MLSSSAPAAKKVAKTNKGRRELQRRQPHRKEIAAKSLLCLHGGCTSDVLKSLINDIAMMKYGECHKMNKKNANIRPFEGGGEVSLEFYAEKSNASTFAFASHQKKKRPNSLTLGRFYNHQLYDAVELLVENFEQISKFGKVASSATVGSKPCMLFLGDRFETDSTMKMLKNIITDIFRGRVVSRINLKGIDRSIVVSATDDGKILFRQFAIKYKKSGTRLPLVHLDEMGPRFDAKVGRARPPPVDLEREALKVDKRILKEEKAQLDNGGIKDKVGKIHVQKQTGLEDVNRARNLKGGLKKRRV